MYMCMYSCSWLYNIIIRTDFFLEFVAAKFNICSTFYPVRINWKQEFINFTQTWKQNIYAIFKASSEIFPQISCSPAGKISQNSKIIIITINHVISECSKLAKKDYKMRHDWMEKVIHKELCKKFKFDHTNKCYMHNPESIQEKETYKILCDFEIQTDHLISD